MRLTAVVICRSRREKGFERALASVGFADEVLVVERREISDWAAVRNEAMERAKGEWVMFVDSDEEVSEELKREIQEVTDKSYKSYKNYNISGAYFSGAYFKRRDRFLEKWLNHGETARVRLLRLARKGAGRWERPVHEVWKVGGKAVTLMNPISHYSHESLDEMVEKLDRYSGMEAGYRFDETNKLTKRQTNKKTNKSLNKNIIKVRLLTEMAIFPLVKFIQNYFWRLGFLDGMEGLIHAFMMSGHSFLVRAKLLTRSEYPNASE